MHLLYIPLSRKETLWGLLLLAAAVLSSPVLPGSVLEIFIFQGLLFLGAVVVFRRFLATSAQIPLTPPLTVLKFALLGLIFAQLANLLSNDLIFYFLPGHFGYGDTGPYFLNARKELIRTFAAENFPLTAITVILFVPVWEELIHRGLVFGSLVQKNLPIAYVAAMLLYALLPIIPLWGTHRIDYLILSFLQYIPISLMFCWVYTQTETILTPILAHMVMNAVSIFTMR